jgi:hypothetical protein
MSAAARTRSAIIVAACMPTPKPSSAAALALPASATPIAACCVPAFPGCSGTDAATFWAATTTSAVQGAAGT